MRVCLLLALALLVAPPPAAAQQPDTAVQWLAALDLALVEQGWERARADSSVDGRPLRIGGRTYARGVGSHSDGIARLRLDRALRFVADVGVDDEAISREGVSRGTVRFRFIVDRRLVHETPILRGGDAPVRVEIDLRGARELWLLIDATEDGNAYDHADWADARIVYTARAEAPRLYRPPPAPAVVLTPAPPAAPRITGPEIIGGSVGKPFLYRIPATGQRPLRYFIEGLPPGLLADPATGIITGRAQQAGRYPVTVGAENDAGVVERTLTLAFGEGLALTPPMGWNSWNIWGCAIDDAKIRAAGDRLVDSGLADHGWNHVNIDDCWMRKPGPDARDPVTGAILTNERFPDMKGLADYLHARGLRLGIYIGPNERTCQGYEASIGHERADLEQFARWGVDYVKYDWCSSRRDSLVEKYTMYGELLKTLDRDITYSICQYGWQNVWEWGARAGGNLWRTTGDIVDTWGSMAGIGFNQDRMAPFAGPGHWNDPDMLVVGMVGWGPKPRPTRLTPDEQYTHISLWSLLAAPLLIGADLDQLDAFTLNLLTNDEVLAIDQDPLGKQATRVAGAEGDVWARPLADGSWAVGLFNRDFDERRVRIEWSALGIAGPLRVRDVWRQIDLGTHADGYEAIVPPHGVMLLRTSFPIEVMAADTILFEGFSTR